MQLTRETVDLYKSKAPELMNSVASGESEFIMKRDEKTDYCVQFVDGWCGIHKKYGTDLLGDACHFYPRATRALADTPLMTLALSCPESARLMLYEEGSLVYSAQEKPRLPYSLKNFAPEELSGEVALKIHEACVAEMGNADYSAEHNLMRLSAMATGLALQPQDAWEGAVPFYFRMAEGRIPPAEAHSRDLFMLLNALQGLVSSAPKSPRERLMRVMGLMASAMNIELNWDTLILNIRPDAPERVLRMLAWWKTHGEQYQTVLRRYLQAQLRLNLFPFAGLGKTLTERVTIIGVRFATVKLALMSACFEAQGAIGEAEVVRIIQSLSRFQDHLADSELSISMYQELGWTREARLRALVGDL